MKNKFVMIFANDVAEARFLVETDNIDRAIDEIYAKQDVQAAGISYRDHFSADLCLDDIQAPVFGVFQTTEQGLVPFVRHDKDKKPVYYPTFSLCLHKLNSFFASINRSEYDDLHPSLFIEPLILKDDGQVIFANNGKSTGFNAKDFSAIA